MIYRLSVRFESKGAARMDTFEEKIKAGFGGNAHVFATAYHQHGSELVLFLIDQEDGRIFSQFLIFSGQQPGFEAITTEVVDPSYLEFFNRKPAPPVKAAFGSCLHWAGLMVLGSAAGNRP